MRAALAFAGLLALSGCHGAAGPARSDRLSTTSAAGAAVMTGVAVASSGISRAMGGCYATCSASTVCNQQTGLCDPLPCNGQCDKTERCDPISNQCVHDPAGDVVVQRQQTAVEREEDPHKPDQPLWLPPPP